MTCLVFPAPLYQRFKYTCVPSPGNETAAIAFTVGGDLTPAPNLSQRRLVKEIWLPKDDDYHERTPVSVALKPDYVLTALIHAQTHNYGVVFLHTHPMDDYPEFSSLDDNAEATLRTLFEQRAPGRLHMSVVVGTQGVAARVLGHNTPVIVSVLGRRLQVISSEADLTERHEGRYDRQVAVVSQKGQKRLAEFLVAIVGLGGTGSLVAQQLAYLGFRRFLLIDTDRIELTNLNRVVGAQPADIGTLKYDVAKWMIKSIQPDAQIETMIEDVCEEAAVRELAAVDAIICCTDSHGSRAVINKLAYQYLVPTIDMGARIDVSDDGDVSLRGRAQLLAPGEACLLCHELLNSDRIRYELQSAEQRKRDPYGLPPDTVQPAVISLNSTISSHAVTMLLQVLTSLDGEVRSVRYDGVLARARELIAQQVPTCPDCSEKYFAAGDSEPLFCRGRDS